MLKFKDLLNGIDWDSQVSVGAAVFVPIIGELQSEVDVDVAISSEDGIHISELESESVNQVYIESAHNKRKLVISGLVIEGGKQTRTVTRPFIITKNGKRIIDVNCIEQGRWHYSETSSNFDLKGKFVSRKMKSSFSLGHGTQGSTWQSINTMMDEHDVSGVEAPSQSFLDVEEKIREKQDSKIKDIKKTISPAFKMNKQRGVMVFEEGKLSNMEVFDDSKKWERVGEKILDANLVDTITLAEKEPVDVIHSLPEIKTEMTAPVADEEAFVVRLGEVRGWGVATEGNAVYLTLGEASDVPNNYTNIAQEQVNFPAEEMEQIQRPLDL